MKLRKVKNLLLAPKDAEGLYLVVTPSQLVLDKDTNWKDGRSAVSIEVWRRKGNANPTQEGMGDYSVSVFKNGSSTVSVLKHNTPSFSVSAAKTDKSLEIVLIKGDTKVDTKTVTVSKDGTDGTNGTPGGNTATVFLFRRSASAISAIDWSDTLTYTFATQQLNSVPTGWTLNKIPSGTAPIYVTAATAYSIGATDTIAANEWATPVLFVENGEQGEHGLNSAPVFLFKRSASKPDKPTDTLTYTFATGKLSGTLAGWSQTIPATDGNPCWVIQATAVGTGVTDTIAASEWSEQQEYVRDGGKGEPGGNTATIYLFKRSSSAISAIDWSDTLTYTFATQQLNSVPTGWTLNKIPSGTAPIYVTAATAYSTGTTDTIAANEWATPVLFVENGEQGEHGLNSAPVFLFKRSASKPNKPTATLTYTFATGKLSGTLAGWSQTIPATDGNPCWVIQATAVGTGATDTIAASEWSEQQEYVKDGGTGGQGPTGPEGNGITGHKTFYLATTMATGVTRSTDASSWTETYQQATPDKPYVWRYEVTYYRDTSPSYTDCELIFSYSAGANHNLLEQTNFSSVQGMSKWGVQSYYAPPYISGYKVWSESVQYYLSTSSTMLYGGSWSDTEPSSVPSGNHLWTRKKLVYGKVNSSGNFVDASGNVISTGGTPATQTVYQTPDSGIGIGVDGHGVISTGTQAHNAYKDGTRLTSSTMHYKEVLQQVLNSEDGTIKKLEASKWYTLSFWAKGDGCQTYIYPSCFDNNLVCYIDEVMQNANTMSSDAYVSWTFDGTWKQHTFTFKTKSSIGAEEQRLLFRLNPKTSTDYSNNVELCMPKLEVGMQATGYQSNEGSIHNGQLRIRRWAMNTEYMAGALDEPYDDTVAKDPGLYHCIKAHISTRDNEPGLGANWERYWETGSKVGFLATDIFLAKKAVIKNLISELIMTGYEGRPHIEAQGSEFKIFGNGKYPIVELAINDNGKGVLRFLNEETGAIYYDLGPDGIAKTLAQDEKITSSDKYQVVGLTDNTDGDIWDAGSYFDNIFNSTKAANNVTILYTYEAKIVANQFDPGLYCATADDARNANKRMFLSHAESTSTGEKYIRDIKPFTGLLCYSWHSATNGGLHECSSSYALLGYYVYEGNAVPDDYDEDFQGGVECNFMTDDEGYYLDPVCYRTVIHILEGKWNGVKTVYYNKSKVKS